MRSSYWPPGESRLRGAFPYRLVELQKLPLAGVTHVAQHGLCQPGSCCGSALTTLSMSGHLLLRVFLHSHTVQQRAPQAGMQLAVRVGRVRGGLR